MRLPVLQQRLCGPSLVVFALLTAVPVLAHGSPDDPALGETTGTESAEHLDAPAPAGPLDAIDGEPATDDGEPAALDRESAAEAGVSGAPPLSSASTDPTTLLPTPLDLAMVYREASVTPRSKPRVSVGGFADVDAQVASNLPGVDLIIGQLVAHVSADLTGGFGAFAEVTLNSRPSWEVRVERLLLFWERSDALKLTLGRFHIPVTWWNDTFHHGVWLQTSARRPLMVGYDDAFVPNHAVGLYADGFVPGLEAVGLRYHVGLNGGGDDYRHLKHGGDVSVQRADRRLGWTAGIAFEPRALPLFRIGGVAYGDPMRARAGEQVGELAVGGHVVYAGELPEVIAEYVWVRHDAHESRDVYDNHGFYVQTAVRLPKPVEQLKPYLRYEQMWIDPGDPTLLDKSSEQLAMVGLRIDATSWLAFKVEAAWRKRIKTAPFAEGYVQVSAAW